MQGQYEQQLKQILQKLHINSIDDLLQLDSISPDRISSRSKVHPLIVEQYLMRIHEIALKTQLIDRKVYSEEPMKQTAIRLADLFPNHAIHFPVSVEEGEMLEVLGRANSGKTTLLINCIKQALGKGMQPILLSSSKTCSQQYIQHIGAQKLMIFQFETISQLAMHIHAIGNQILTTGSQSPQKYLLLIDSLSQIQQQQQSIQFDCSEKFRRLLTIFSSRTQTSIIYAYRVGGGLFQTQFKKETQRPKCKNSKEWDGWASKGLVLDFVIRKRDGRFVGRVGVCKGLDCRIYEGVLPDLQ